MYLEQGFVKAQSVYPQNFALLCFGFSLKVELFKQKAPLVAIASSGNYHRAGLLCNE